VYLSQRHLVGLGVLGGGRRGRWGGGGRICDGRAIVDRRAGIGKLGYEVLGR
jgi:hypothetical protein